MNYQEISDKYDEILNEVRESGTQSSLDEHLETCHILISRYGAEVKECTDDTLRLLDEAAGSYEDYCDRLKEFANLTNWSQ